MSEVLFPAVVVDGAPRKLKVVVGGVSVRGTSVAARGTALAVPELGVALDIGRLSRALQPSRSGW